MELILVIMLFVLIVGFAIVASQQDEMKYEIQKLNHKLERISNELSQSRNLPTEIPQ